METGLLDDVDQKIRINDPNIKAVKNILDKVDVKSDVQLAKFSKSKDLNIEFNK